MDLTWASGNVAARPAGDGLAREVVMDLKLTFEDGTSFNIDISAWDASKVRRQNFGS